MTGGLHGLQRTEEARTRGAQGREVLEGGGGRGGGGLKGGARGGGGSAGSPPPMVPAEGRPKNFEASILLALKVPRQNCGCQPQTLQEEEGGGQGGYPPSSYAVRPF